MEVINSHMCCCKGHSAQEQSTWLRSLVYIPHCTMGGIISAAVIEGLLVQDLASRNTDVTLGGLQV